MSSTRRTLEISISRSNIVDKVAEFLHQLGILHNNEIITNITFGSTDQAIVPIKVTFKKEVNFIKHQ